MKKLLLILMVLPLFCQGQYPWQQIPTTFNHVIAVPDTINLSVCGEKLEVGDQLGVFYDSSGILACGGVIIWYGQTTAFPVWGNNITTSSNKNGFYEGEPFKWKLFKKSTKQIINLEFGYMDSLITFSVQDMGYFRINGASALNNDKQCKLNYINPTKPNGEIYNLDGKVIKPKRGYYIKDRKLYFNVE